MLLPILMRTGQIVALINSFCHMADLLARQPASQLVGIFGRPWFSVFRFPFDPGGFFSNAEDDFPRKVF